MSPLQSGPAQPSQCKYRQALWVNCFLLLERNLDELPTFQMSLTWTWRCLRLYVSKTEVAVQTLGLQPGSFSRLFLKERWSLNTQTVPRESLQPPSWFSSGKPSAVSSLVFEPQSLTNSEKSFRFVWKKILTWGPSGNQTVLWGCAPQDSLITLWTSIHVYCC